MSVIIHGRASSSNVQAVMWGLGELELTVERLDVGGRFGGTGTPAFRALSPMGLIPAIQDGDTTLFESAAILRYAVATYNDGQMPSTTPQQDAWAEWAKHSLAEAFTVPVFSAFYRTPEAQRDMAAVTRALRRFEGLLAIAMTLRADQRFLTGEHLSLADIWVGHVLYRYFTLDLPHETPDGTEIYYRSLCQRRAYQKHVMLDYVELKGRLVN